MLALPRFLAGGPPKLLPKNLLVALGRADSRPDCGRRPCDDAASISVPPKLRVPPESDLH